MMILALDPATKCGWAHTSGISGTWDLSVRKDESSGMRLIRLRSKLNEIKEAVPIDLVAYEAVRNAALRNQRALIVQSEIQGQIKIWCEENGIEYQGVSPTEIKKFALGSGKGSKEDMVDALERLERRIIQDKQHDEVDAIWLLKMMESRYV